MCAFPLTFFTHQILSFFLLPFFLGSVGVSVHVMKFSSVLPVTQILGLTLCLGFILNTQYSHSPTYVRIMFHGAVCKTNFM